MAVANITGLSAGEKAKKLRSLIRLLSDSAEVVIKEWEAEEQTPPAPAPANSPHLPSPALFEARRTFVGACGMGLDLVQDPIARMSEINASYFNSRALRVATEARVADVLDGADPEEGVSIHDISQQVGIEAPSLTRVLRCLCSVHIFAEVKDNHYANNTASRCLVRNEPLRCWFLMYSTEAYTASNKLPEVLYNSIEPPYDPPRKSAFQTAYGTRNDFWEWLEQLIELPDGSVGPRPEREIWRLGMWEFGLQYVQAPAVCDDYPWEELGSSVVVDVGAGIGGMSMELAKRFPNLRFIVQDRALVVQEAEEVWRRELPDALSTGRVQLVAHNFFAEQPTKGADVYLMRHIMHDWADEECITILTSIRNAMRPESRVLIADNVMQTTVGSKYLRSAPAPLPANYGYAHSFANMHDLVMFTMFRGGERTPEEFGVLAARAGLKVTKVWECRGLTSITEMRRDDYVA